MTTVATADLLSHRPVLGEEDYQLLEQLADGLPLDAAARRRNMSERTIRRRIGSLCDRIGVSNSTQVVVWAVRVRVL